MAEEFCPRCGSQRIGSFRFCRSCQFDFDGLLEGQPAPAVAHASPAPTVQAVPTAAPPGVSVQPAVADMQLDLERMRLKLIPIRILGLVVGLAAWWLLVLATPDSVGLWLLAFPVAAFGGLYVGNVAGLAMIRRR